MSRADRIRHRAPAGQDRVVGAAGDDRAGGGDRRPFRARSARLRAAARRAPTWSRRCAPSRRFRSSCLAGASAAGIIGIGAQRASSRRSTWRCSAIAYGGTPIDLDNAPRELRTVEDGKIVVRRRDLGAERAAKKRLEGFGLPRFEAADTGDAGHIASASSTTPTAWPRFVYDAVPQLEREGWRIEIEDGFRHRVVDGGGEWTAGSRRAAAGGSRSISGSRSTASRCRCCRCMTSLLARLRDLGTPDGLDALAHNGTVFGTLARRPSRGVAARPHQGDPRDAGRAVSPGNPVRQGPHRNLGRRGGRARRTRGGDRIALARRRAAAPVGRAPGEFRRRSPRSTRPPVCRPQLRPYQRDGLDWLQFLRDYELGGILADDMGLGKTVQTLAHILVEKREGRLDRPCLVVCPTSVVPNWLAEAARLAPELQGPVVARPRPRAALRRDRQSRSGA